MRSALNGGWHIKYIAVGCTIYEWWSDFTIISGIWVPMRRRERNVITLLVDGGTILQRSLRLQCVRKANIHRHALSTMCVCMCVHACGMQLLFFCLFSSCLSYNSWHSVMNCASGNRREKGMSYCLSCRVLPGWCISIPYETLAVTAAFYRDSTSSSLCHTQTQTCAHFLYLFW